MTVQEKKKKLFFVIRLSECGASVKGSNLEDGLDHIHFMLMECSRKPDSVKHGCLTQHVSANVREKC